MAQPGQSPVENSQDECHRTSPYKKRHGFRTTDTGADSRLHRHARYRKIWSRNLRKSLQGEMVCAGGRFLRTLAHIEAEARKGSTLTPSPAVSRAYDRYRASDTWPTGFSRPLLDLRREFFVRERGILQMTTPQPKNPLHGITLEKMLSDLVDSMGWAQMGRRVAIRCFTHDPSLSSSLRFLRRTPWARTKVEELYLQHMRGKT